MKRYKGPLVLQSSRMRQIYYLQTFLIFHSQQLNEPMKYLHKKKLGHYINSNFLAYLRVEIFPCLQDCQRGAPSTHNRASYILLCMCKTWEKKTQRWAQVKKHFFHSMLQSRATKVTMHSSSSSLGVIQPCGQACQLKLLQLWCHLLAKGGVVEYYRSREDGGKQIQEMPEWGGKRVTSSYLTAMERHQVVLSVFLCDKNFLLFFPSVAMEVLFQSHLYNVGSTLVQIVSFCGF